MILPFYTDINRQEFRIFADNQDLLRSIKFFSDVEEIPAFMFETNSADSGTLTNYIVYIDDHGDEITRIPCTTIQKKFYLGKYLFFSLGEKLGFEHLYCRYYIEINDTALGQFHSEVVTRIREVKPGGRLLLNTGAYVLLNTRGYILLNASTTGFLLDNLTKITARTSKNYANLDLQNIEFKFYVETRPFLEESYESTVSEENAGIETVFQKVRTSVWSLEFFAISNVADQLMDLSFFDNIVITDPEGREQTVINRPEITKEERVNYSGVYRIKFTYKTEYKIDLQLLTVNEGQEDEEMSLASQVGVIQMTPSNKPILDFIAAMNTIYANTGFRAIPLNGSISELEPDQYPIAKAILGTAIGEGGLPKIKIPNCSGLVLIGSGTREIKTVTKTFSSGGIAPDGEYNHKLTKEEMYHIHQSGAETAAKTWMGNFLQETIQNATIPFTPTENLPPTEPVQSENLYSTSIDEASDLPSRVFTLPNCGSPEFLLARAPHNNIQPAIGAHPWMIIDEPLT